MNERRPLSARARAFLALGLIASLALLVTAGDAFRAIRLFAVLTSHPFGRWVPALEEQERQAMDFYRRAWPEGMVVDAWNNPRHYRSPGPMHRRGFFVLSCGPNGIDEEGAGDDILMGAELLQRPVN